MDKSQLELRRAAAQAFIESLDHLKKSVSHEAEAVETGADNDSAPAQSLEENPDEVVDLDAWADAAADIEQFIQARHSTSDQMTG